jgi:hypothetical protein
MMVYRVIAIIPYYIVSVDWAMMKMVSLLEVKTIHHFIHDLTSKVSYV